MTVLREYRDGDEHFILAKDDDGVYLAEQLGADSTIASLETRDAKEAFAFFLYRIVQWEACCLQETEIEPEELLEAIAEQHSRAL